jgi:hypothetical protein
MPLREPPHNSVDNSLSGASDACPKHLLSLFLLG